MDPIAWKTLRRDQDFLQHEPHNVGITAAATVICGTLDVRFWENLLEPNQQMSDSFQ